MSAQPTPEENAALDASAAYHHERQQWAEEAGQGRMYRYLTDPDIGTSSTPRWPEDVAPFVREEQEPPDMLVPRWLVRGVLHWLYSDAEAGKTWLALALALHVMQAGEVVLWVDEELSRREVGDRLRALGADPDVVHSNLVYLEHPGFLASEYLEWQALLQQLRPSLVVFDTATDMLTLSGADEDRGTHVTAWVKRYPEAATALGITTLVLDHVAKSEAASGGRHAVGSRAKRAKAKVQWSLTSRGRYDRDTLGRVKVQLTKNTLGAELPRDPFVLEMGGDGDGGFVLRPAGIEVPGEGGQLHDLHHKIVTLLQEEGGPLTTSQIRERVVGGNAAIGAALAALASGSDWPVQARTQGRGTVYEYVQPAAEAEPSP